MHDMPVCVHSLSCWSGTIFDNLKLTTANVFII